MIKLKDIAEQVIKEGGKAFGIRANRITTEEMFKVFNELKNKVGKYFSKMELNKSLLNKTNHGDIDIVILNDKGHDIKKLMVGVVGDSLKDFLKNGNVNSMLYHSDVINKDVHVDFIATATEEDFQPQYMYLNWGDISGILGVMARALRFNYGTLGMFKIYEDKRGQYHYVLLTKNLYEGLKMLGYGKVLDRYENIKSEDDIVDFISSSPLFDSNYYKGMMGNYGDRKRCRIGRKSADYIRHKLEDLNIHRKIDDNDHFLKLFFPRYYDKLQKDIHEIENKVIITARYGGDWLLSNFPQIKPGPIIAKIKNFWVEKYGKDNIDDVNEEQIKNDTAEFLRNIK